MPCECDDYKENAPKIDSFVMLGFTHGMEYDGKPWEYCPWCGKLLVSEEEQDVD